MTCFDGRNANVIWSQSGNAYAWKTGTQLTNYVTPPSRYMGTAWCSDDGWLYSTEYALVQNPANGQYEQRDITLLRRSQTQAPTVVATLPYPVVDAHTDANGLMSVATANSREIAIFRSSNGTTWQRHSYTFTDPVADVRIAQHDASNLYVATLPQILYTSSEPLPRNRTVTQIAIWKSSNTGQSWRQQATITLPRSCDIAVINTGASTTYDARTCVARLLQIAFVGTPTRYTSPETVALKITDVSEGFLVGKTLFSANSGRTWQDVQQIQGSVPEAGYLSFFNNSNYPGNMNRPTPELIYAPQRIFFTAYALQHLNTTHRYDPIATSVSRATSMSTTDQRTWMPISTAQPCEDSTARNGNQVVTVASMPTVRVCKHGDGIAYSESGGQTWQQISADNPYAQLIAVSDALPLTIVRQQCQPASRYGRYPTLECGTVQYLEVMPDAAVTTPVTVRTPLAVPYEPATQHTIEPRFYRYWQQHGGLAQYGYPISEPFYAVAPDGQRMLVQYFERNRFEWHPQHAGTDYEVQLGLLGTVYGAQSQELQPGPFARQNGNTEPGQIYFAETAHTLRNAFKRHWQSTGGLAQYGYPISEEFYEVNPDNGQTYVVQYFERARFEWHPELIGTPYEVLLGLLGNQLLHDKGW